MKIIAEGLKLIPPSANGFIIGVDEDVPLGDAILLATALDNKIPVVVSNDRHLRKLSRKYGLIYENPLPKDIRLQMK